MKTILVVDDHTLFAEGLVRVLETDPGNRGYVIAGIARTGKQALQMLRSQPVDLVMLDVSLPDTNGIELCKEVKKFYRSTAVLMVSGQTQANVILEAIENGATGYVLKSCTIEQLREAVQSVVSGQTYFCTEVTNIMMQSMVQKASYSHTQLSDRERDILLLIADGYTTSEIAERLCLSTKTIESHRSNMLLKLNARNTAALVKIAKELNLI